MILQSIVNLIVVFLITIPLMTIAFVGIGELFNLLVHKNSKLKEPLSLGHRLFTVFGESFKLARKIKDSSENLEPEFIEAMNRTPLSVMIALVVVIIWCVTGLAAYLLKFSIVVAAASMVTELIVAILAGKKLSDKNKDNGSGEKKCMKCKISKLSVYHTQRLNHKTFADVRLLNGSRFKMIPVENFEMYGQREMSIDIDIYCVVYYDYLPFAKCVIDPKALTKLKS